MSFVWVDKPEVVLVRALQADIERIEAGLTSLLQRYTAEIETWMKANGSWQDQTGNLRQSLFARLQESVQEIAIVMGYGVSYGDYVNYGHQGRFAIIEPALDYFYDRIFAEVKALLA